jgi:hypothetical protein
LLSPLHKQMLKLFVFNCLILPLKSLEDQYTLTYLKKFKLDQKKGLITESALFNLRIVNINDYFFLSSSRFLVSLITSSATLRGHGL